MWENINIIKNMVKGLISIKMDSNMLEIMLMGKNKAMEYFIMEIRLYLMKGNLKMDCLMVKEKHLINRKKYLYNLHGYKE